MTEIVEFLLTSDNMESHARLFSEILFFTSFRSGRRGANVRN